MNGIPKNELKERGIYELASRNLAVGVYDGEEGFVGIRSKFNSLFLDTEYLSRNLGGTKIGIDTVTPYKLVGFLSEQIPLSEGLGSVCAECGKRAWWTGPPAPAPWACEGNCETTHSYQKSNAALFDVLAQIEGLNPEKEEH